MKLRSNRDITRMEGYRQKAATLQQADATRAALHEEMLDMFHMRWSGKPSADWIRQVVTPDAYNAVIGLVRLMMAAEVSISVPGEGNEISEGPAVAHLANDDAMERALRALLRRSDEAASTPLIDNAILSAALFGEVVIRVGNSRDVMALAEESDNAALIQAAKRVPFTFETLNPANVYTESDAYGLKLAVVVEEMTAETVRDFWGERAAHVTGKGDAGVTVFDLWDRTHRAVWCSQSDEPILLEAHKLPFIPVVRRVIQGTTLWPADRGAQVFPLLYALKESGMWDAQNIAYTMIYSLAYAQGSVPFIALRKPTPATADPEIDWSRPGINVTLYGETKLERLPMSAIPDEMVQVLQLTESKAGEMLVPKVVFGSSPTGGMSFSAINLLAQGGRLPLVPIQERTADALARALEITLLWIAHAGEAQDVVDGGRVLTIDPTDIDPERVAVQVSLRPNLPQDRLSLVAAVVQLLDRQVISQRTARDWLNVLDSTGETWQVLVEQYIKANAELYAKAMGEQAQVGETFGAAAEAETPIEQPQEPGQGALFNTGLGGVPAVQQMGAPGASQPDINELVTQVLGQRAPGAGMNGDAVDALYGRR